MDNENTPTDETNDAVEVPAGRSLRRSGDAGMSTAEYAVGTIAAVAFAAILYKIVQSPEVHDALARIITSALNITL